MNTTTSRARREKCHVNSRMRRILAGTIITAAGLTALSGCVLVPHRTIQDDSTLTDRIDAVQFDTMSGNIVIAGVEGLDEVTVHREVRHRFGGPDGDTHRVEGGALHLEGCGWQCSVDYEVEVPVGTAVSGHTTNGRIELTDLGDIDVRTTNGRVTLVDIDGGVTARSSNGRIDAEGLRGGDVNVRTSNGKIALGLDEQENVRARTSNGSIEVTVPDGDYQVELETSNGKTTNELGHRAGANLLIDLQTSNGSIHLKRG